MAQYCSREHELSSLFTSMFTKSACCFITNLLSPCSRDYVPTRRASVRHVPIRRVHPDAVSVRRDPTRRVPFGRASTQYPQISSLNYRLSLFCCYLDTSYKQDCYLLFVTLRFSAARRDGLTMFPRAKV